MKFAIVFLLLVAPCFAQEPCALKTADAPPQGLRLGMLPEEVQNVVGREVKVKVKKNDGKVIFQNFIKKPPPASLAGVRAIYLRFFNRRLYQIEIFYEARNDVKTIEQFTANLSTNFNLPVTAWRDAKGKQEIKCDGFTIVADNVLNPRVELTDNQGQAAFEKAQADKKAKK